MKRSFVRICVGVVGVAAVTLGARLAADSPNGDFGKFVADFENAFPYMRIQNIELDPNPSSSANPSNEPEKLGFKMEIVALVNPNAR